MTLRAFDRKDGLGVGAVKDVYDGDRTDNL